MISVIVPAFNEADGLAELYQRLSAAANSWQEDYELILVDDGSTDSTLGIAKSLAAADARMRVLALARNFGHQAALSAGLLYATGDVIAIIDADLQDPPEELQRFIRKCREGYDVVYAIRQKRKEGLLKRTAYHLYYRLLKMFASIDIPADAGDFCVMTRQMADCINRLPERGRNLRGLRAWVGYRQTGLEYERGRRAFGEPKYTWARLVKLGVDGIFNFSHKPLRIVMLCGGAIAIGTFLLALFILAQYVGNITVLGYNPHQARGWTSLMLALLFLAGVQLIAIGTVGEYVGRLFEEVKARPVFLIKETVNFPESIQHRSGGGVPSMEFENALRRIDALAARLPPYGTNKR